MYLDNEALLFKIKKPSMKMVAKESIIITKDFVRFISKDRFDMILALLFTYENNSDLSFKLTSAIGAQIYILT